MSMKSIFASAVPTAAFLLAVLVVKAVENSFVNDLLKVDISITAFPDIISLTGAVTLFISVTASLFPALYATSFEPAVVLKGNFGLSPRGKQWRNLLMGIQLTAAIGLLIIVGGLVCQNNLRQPVRCPGRPSATATLCGRCRVVTLPPVGPKE